MTRHHRRPKSRNGGREGRRNISLLPEDLHGCWHDMVHNYTPHRIACVFSTLVAHKWIKIAYWKRQEVLFRAIARKDLDQLSKRQKWVNYEKFRRASLGDAWLHRKVTHKTADAFKYAFGKMNIKAFLREVNRVYLDPDWVIVAYKVKRVSEGKSFVQMIL